MSSPTRPRPRPAFRGVVLLLACLAVFAGGCAHMSKPTIGIGGTDDNARQVGH